MADQIFINAEQRCEDDCQSGATTKKNIKKNKIIIPLLPSKLSFLLITSMGVGHADDRSQGNMGSVPSGGVETLNKRNKVLSHLFWSHHESHILERFYRLQRR